LAHAWRRLHGAGYRVFALRPSSLLPVDYGLLGDFFGYANFVAVAPQCMPWLTGNFEDPVLTTTDLVPAYAFGAASTAAR
jgi:hypothetical protein